MCNFHKPPHQKPFLNRAKTWNILKFVDTVKLENATWFTASHPLLKHLQYSEISFSPKVKATQLVVFLTHL